MSSENFSENNSKTTYADECPAYRFQEYESNENHQSPAAFQQNRMPSGNFNFQTERAKDEKHLDQLSLGFKIYAAINALFACIPFIHLFLGIMMVTGRMNDGINQPPAAFGWFFIVFASIFILVGWTFSACNFYAGRFLKERRKHTFCFVMSCINCASVPFGTVVGIFGIIILMRDSVKNIFQENSIK